MTEKITYEETEKKIQESTENQNKYELITETMVHGVQEVDTTGKILFANSIFHRMFGYENGDLIGKSMYDLLSEDTDINALRNYIKILIQEQPEPEPWFGKMVKKNGNLFDVQTDWNYKLNRHGDVIGFISIISDITERIQAEDALKYSQFQLEAILHNLNSSIYIADMQSHEILFMNDHMKDLFGTDLTGSICWKTFHKNLKGPCEFCTNDKLIDADGNPTEPHVWEFYNKKIGRWYELHDQAVPWVDGHLVRMEIAIDITDRKRMEQTLKGSHEKLEQRVKERTSELKELNTALKVLLKNRENDKKEMEEKISSNYKSLILPFIQKLKNSLTEKKQQNLIYIIESNLQESFKSFSKKTSDQMAKLTPTEIQVASLIREGLSNKEIAQTLNNSVRTITNHRQHIRRKLDLENKKINLKSYLSTN